MDAMHLFAVLQDFEGIFIFPHCYNADDYDGKALTLQEGDTLEMHGYYYEGKDDPDLPQGLAGYHHATMLGIRIYYVIDF